ncbi:alpha/beta hydrolase [Yinghuangia soli]|uniref:Alpha/beta hydrolase n=1 Tax=Yinghuangia soli TaxID=2908204 RepID=A0AA41Q3Q4_9ACTN|nr:alpha/beta hydrolase [Yinghuangia soli]MCF2530662.1 alpha/beta hydrolase [Yinghuangia soli]
MPATPPEPAVRGLIDAMTSVFPQVGTELDDAVQARALLGAAPKSPAPVVPVADVRDRIIPGPGGDLPVRIYRPLGSQESDVLPVVVFLHGGGWVLCSIDSHDQTCRSLANATGAVFVSVEYRLAPETRFPGAAEDAYAAYIWARENAAEFGGDPARVAVAGDSAGGNLAAAVPLMARDRGAAQPTFQLLLYPVVDHRRATDSYTENATGYFLTAAQLAWFWRQYIGPDGDPAHPYASPGTAEDLSGLAPAFVVAPALDPLRDEGVAYAERLAAAGVPAEYRVYEGMFHGAISMGALVPSAAAAFADATEALRKALA